jgi:heptosyltransferase-2
VALGSKGERPIAAEIVKGLPEGSAFNLAGETKLDELMALLKASSACLANDSGVMHLAAALGLKGVAIFGSTDPSATSPVSKNWRMLFEKLDCSPCFKRDCPKGSKDCLSRITPEMAIDALESLN